MRDQAIFNEIGGPTICGDSGSGVLGLSATNTNVDRRLQGLLFGGDSKGGHYNPLAPVLAALNLTIDLSECQIGF